MNIRALVLVPVCLAAAVALAQTPVDTLNSMSANAGLYANQIPALTLDVAYSEICFRGGSEPLVDIHPSGGSTAGGNCQVGDLGFVIEADDRSAATWTGARIVCLSQRMRLPEPFEFQYACENASDFGLSQIQGDDFEWVSNFAQVNHRLSLTDAGIAVPAMGQSSCHDGSWGWVAVQNLVVDELAYRCVR